MRHALFNRGLKGVVAGVDVRNVALNRGGKGIGFEFAAAADKCGAIGEPDACLARCGNRAQTTTGNSRWDRGIVVLGFENVKGAGADVADTEQDVRGQLALDRQVPFISCGDMIIAAGVVAHRDLVERGNIGKVRGRRERIRKGRVAGRLCSAAIKSSLGRRLLA